MTDIRVRAADIKFSAKITKYMQYDHKKKLDILNFEKSTVTINGYNMFMEWTDLVLQAVMKY